MTLFRNEVWDLSLFGFYNSQEKAPHVSGSGRFFTVDEVTSLVQELGQIGISIKISDPEIQKRIEEYQNWTNWSGPHSKHGKFYRRQISLLQEKEQHLLGLERMSHDLRDDYLDKQEKEELIAAVHYEHREYAQKAIGPVMGKPLNVRIDDCQKVAIDWYNAGRLKETPEITNVELHIEKDEKSGDLTISIPPSWDLRGTSGKYDIRWVFDTNGRMKAMMEGSGESGTNYRYNEDGYLEYTHMWGYNRNRGRETWITWSADADPTTKHITQMASQFYKKDPDSDERMRDGDLIKDVIDAKNNPIAVVDGTTISRKTLDDLDNNIRDAKRRGSVN